MKRLILTLGAAALIAVPIVASAAPRAHRRAARVDHLEVKRPAPVTRYTYDGGHTRAARIRAVRLAALRARRRALWQARYDVPTARRRARYTRRVIVSRPVAPWPLGVARHRTDRRVGYRH